MRDPNAIGYECEYDVLGREVECTDTANFTTSSVYDLSGNKVESVDAKSHSTYQLYDSRGRLVKHTDRNGSVTEFGYDAGGNHIYRSDPDGNVTEYAYDSLGHVTTEKYANHVANTFLGDADYGIVAYTYNPASRLLRKTDQTGATITYVYDLADQLIAREYRTLQNSPHGAIEDQDGFTYNPAGRLLTALKGRYGNAVTFSYDDAGRTSSESLMTHGQTYTVQSEYDSAGRVSELTYPDGSLVGRSYNSRSLLAGLTYNTSTIDTRSYDDGGRLASETHGNGLVTTRSYVAGRNLLASINNSAVGNYSYTWDVNGNKLSETITGVMAPYGFTVPANGYDAEDRLTAWNRDDSNLDQSWNLSPVGDWTSFTENAATETRTHGPTHELTAIGSTSLTYDSKGNLTTNSNGQTYTWDMDNMLATATVPNGCEDGIEGTHEYEYDALGRRVAKTVDDVPQMTTDTTVYVHNGQIVVSEYSAGTAASTPLRNYVNGGYVDEPVALIDQTEAGEIAGGVPEVIYLERNQQYSIVALTDASGDVIERYAYTAYGQMQMRDPTAAVARTASEFGNSVSFAGRSYDIETDLYYFRARQYSPHLGRFISVDSPSFTDGSSAYSAYFVPDGTDPSGMNSEPSPKGKGGIAPQPTSQPAPKYPPPKSWVCGESEWHNGNRMYPPEPDNPSPYPVPPGIERGGSGECWLYMADQNKGRKPPRSAQIGSRNWDGTYENDPSAIGSACQELAQKVGSGKCTRLTIAGHGISNGCGAHLDKNGPGDTLWLGCAKMGTPPFVKPMNLGELDDCYPVIGGRAIIRICSCSDGPSTPVHDESAQELAQFLLRRVCYCRGKACAVSPVMGACPCAGHWRCVKPR